MNIIKTCKSTNDVYYSLTNEFKNDNSNNCIILSAFNLNEDIKFYKQKYDKIIVFNLEQYWDKFFENKNYISFLKNADEVWDYDEENIKNLSYIRNDIKLHILKPFIIIPEETKEYDVLFYGCLNDRRLKIINELLKNNVNIKVLNGITSKYDKELNSYIAKSKCLLNIHKKTGYNLQEQARMIRWLGNGKIFSEKSIHNYLNVDEYEYNDLVYKIMEYLNNL